MTAQPGARVPSATSGIPARRRRSSSTACPHARDREREGPAHVEPPCRRAIRPARARGAGRRPRGRAVRRVVGHLQHAVADPQAGEVGRARRRDLGDVGLERPRQVGRPRQPQRTADRRAARRSAAAREREPAPRRERPSAARRAAGRRQEHASTTSAIRTAVVRAGERSGRAGGHVTLATPAGASTPNGASSAVSRSPPRVAQVRRQRRPTAPARRWPRAISAR